MTRQELAQKVKAKYPELRGFDDETVVAGVLEQTPEYSAYLTDDDIGSNVVIESAKQFGLGAAETIGQAAEGAVINLSLSMANPTMSKSEFYNSIESTKNSDYDTYARLNNIKLEKQKKGMEFADAIKGWTEEKLPEYLNANEEYGNTFAGQVFRGLGQFLGYGTVGTAGTVASFGNPMGGVAAVYGTAFFNRQIEFLEDAERTLGLDLMEMDKDTRDKIVGGSWTYGLTTGALDATVFRYITRTPGLNTPTVKNLLSNLVRGQAVPSGQLKTVLANTAKAAFAEGTQESLGDGLTLDALARSLYDDDRELITGDALGRRVTEFALGGTVGGLGKTGIDLIRPRPRTEEEVQKFKDVLKKVDEKLKTVEGETDQQKFKIQFEQKASGETDITEVKASSPEEALEIFNETYKGMYELDSARIYTGEVEVQETAPVETVEVKEPEGIEDIEGKVIDDGRPMVKEPVGIQSPEGKPVDDGRPIDPENLRLSARKGVPLNNERTPIIDSSLRNLSDEELEAYGDKVDSEVFKIETEFDNQTEEEETVEFLQKMGEAQDRLFSFEIENFRRQVNYAIEGYKNGTYEDLEFLREKMQELPDTPSGNVKLAILLDRANRENLLPELSDEFKRETSRRISRDPSQAGNISEVNEFKLQQIMQRGSEALKSLQGEQTDLRLRARKFKEQAQQAPVKQSDIAHEKTQRSNTIKTYDIINKSKYMPEGGRVLDFGAGLGEGAALMGAESFEPNPQAGFEPTYTNPDEIPSNSYDFVTSLSVLNVIPGRQIRDEVVKDIGRILKKNGKAVITARSDVDSYYKNKPELKTEEFGEVGYISGDRTYQKNFKQKELVDYIQGVLGKGFKVTPLDVSVSGSSVLIEKVAEGTYEALQEAVMATDEEELRLGARRLRNQIEDVDNVIDNPTTVETDPGEGGKVRSIAKKYQLKDSEVLDFQDSKNITKGANRIARVLEKAFGQFPKFSKWYSSRLKMALSILEELDPDIKKPEDSFITKVLLAITSNGNEVSPQTEESYRIYQEWKKTGSVVVSETSGTRKGAIIDHLNLFQDLLNKHGYKKVRKFLSTTGTVKELREELVNNFGFSKKVATDVTNGELIDEQVPFSLIFGAKLGSFFNNLNGNFDTTTMDRWFMRTFGRTMGQQLVKIDNSKQKKRFFDSIESLLADKDQSVFLDKKVYKSKDITVRDLLPVDGNVDPLNLKRIIVFFGKPENRMFDGKSLTTNGKSTEGAEKINEFRAAVNNFHKKFDGLEIIEAPKGGSHRRFIRQVMDKALTKFNKKNNVNFTPAEAQALLWYYEKLVHDSNGSRQKDEAPDYGSAANKLYRKLRGTDSSRFRTSDAVRRRTPVSGGDQAVSQGEQPAGVGRLSARQPKSPAQVELEIEAQATKKYITDKFGDIFNSPELNRPEGKKDGFIIPEKKLKVYMDIDGYGPQDRDEVAYYDPIFHTIVVNLRNLNTKTFSEEGISMVIREEIIHALAHNRGLDAEALGKSLTKSQRYLIEQVYNYGEPMSDYEAGGEYFRAAVQNFSYGGISEQMTTMKQGKAWMRVKRLIQSIQGFVTRAFKNTSDPQGVALIVDVANLLAKIDPEARPVEQKTILAARKVISPVTGEPVLNVGDFTEDPIKKEKKSILKPLLLPKKDGKMTFAEAYLVPAGQTLRNIHASLEKVFTDYVKGKDQRIHELHRLAESFALKFKGIKDKADKQALTQLISFSKFDNEGSQFTDEQAQELYSKRDALLDKYGMFNEYLAITQALKQIRHEVMTYVGEIGFVENYWPRYLSPKKYTELREKYGLDKKTFEDEIKAQNEERKANTVTAYRVVTYDEAGLEVPGNLYPTRGEAQAEVDSLGNSFVKKEEVNKPLPPMEKGGVEEALFIEKLLTGRGFDPKAGKPKFTKTRKLEIIPEEDLEFYDSPTKALSRYFTSMVSLIETTKFIGRMQPDTRVIKGQTVYQYDPRSKMAQTVQDLINRPEFADSVNQEKLYQTLPEITRMLMAKGGKEFGLFAWFRQFSYGTLLIEFTSTLSQLYDLPFTMYDNGFFETLRSAANVATGKGVADVRELFDINRIMDAYENDSDFFADVIKTGLKITGFTKMDQFMKETTMDANYKRYLKVSKDINPDGTIKEGLRGKRLTEAKKALKELNIFLASTDPDFQQQDIQRFLQAVKTETNQRTQYQNDLIKSVLIVKLFENQPMNILRLPPKISENPNLRGLITMKSFMLVQINSTRNIALNDLFGNGRTKSERLEAAKRLTKLIGFFIAIGIPVDALKDWLVGRPGYLPDYAFNGAVRVFGINKFLFFQLRKEGLGQAMLDFTLPVPLARGIGVLNEMSAVAQGEGPIESGIVKNMPFSDVFYYRVPEVREKQRKFVQRRRKQEGEFLFGLPDPFEQLAPEPIINPFR